MVNAELIVSHRLLLVVFLLEDNLARDGGAEVECLVATRKGSHKDDRGRQGV
jgi:hypothetical protein